MLMTVAEARASSLDTVSGSCPAGAPFLRLLNEATQRLMRRGDWVGTVVPVQVCTIGGCVVWPRYVGQVRKMNLCGMPVTMRNNWYQFLQYDNPRMFDYWNTNYGYGYGGAGWGSVTSFPNWWGWRGAQAYTTGGVETPVFQDIMGEGRFIRFYPEVQADIGKTVTVFGTDNNGQPLRHKISDTEWRDGIVLTLAAPYVSSSDYVRHIDRLIFDDHQGTIRAYAYNATETTLEEVGTYEAHDNNPSFTRYQVHSGYSMGCPSDSSNGGCNKSVIALVKLRFIPARYDTDLVLIDNLPALKLMFQCIKYEEAGDRASARGAEADAIRELNLQLTDAYPLDQTPVGNGVFAGTGIGRQRCY